MDTTIANENGAAGALPAQEGLAGVRRGKRPAGRGGGHSIERRLNLHSVHIMALEAMVAGMSKGNGIDAAKVYAYIDERTGEGNANLGAAAKKVAAGMMDADATTGTPGAKPPMAKRAASWLIGVLAAVAIVTAGFVGVAVLILKSGFGD